MPLETAAYIHQLNPANPASADRLMQGDDHLRLIKAALKATFPNLTGPMTQTEKFLNEDLPARLIPTGAITLFYGDEAPTGWAICNGQKVNKADGSGTITTPDLRGRVAVGVSDALALGALTGQTNRTITTEVAGGHTHTGKVPAHGHSATIGGSIGTANTGSTLATTQKTDTAGGGTGRTVATATITDPGHTHSAANLTVAVGDAPEAAVTLEAAAGHAHAATVDVTQPSLALHYIIKL